MESMEGINLNFGKFLKGFDLSRGLFVPKKKNNVLAILSHVDFPDDKRMIECRNIVTNGGDLYYAQAPTSASQANYNTMYLGTGVGAAAKGDNFGTLTLIASSNKVLTVDIPTYPRASDSDPDNTGSGADIVSFKFEYDAVDGNFVNITEAVIGTSTASGTDEVLCRFLFGGAFTKDTSTILKVYVNHEALGV